MQHKALKIGFSAILILLLAVSFTLAQPVPCDDYPWGNWDFPRLDDIWMVCSYPAATSLEEAKACNIDVFIGAIDPDHVAELSGDPYNWEVSMTTFGGFHMCYHGFNCRDTPPDTAGVYVNMFNRTTDFTLYPLNISSFRLALQYVVGVTTKTAWIEDIYQFINRPQMFYIPFANFYWVNPYLEWYPTDWDTAVDVLIENGFTRDPGPDQVYNTFDVASTDDIWYMPNGSVLYNGLGTAVGGNGYCERYAGLDTGGDPIWGIFVASPGDGLAPTSHEISRRHLAEWNRFFTGVSQDGVPDSTNTALFIDLPDDVYDYIYFSSFYNRDHDIFMLCWGLGAAPDYLYDLFHPDLDTPGWGNSPGLVHAGLDRMLYALKYWIMKDFEVLEKNLGEEPTVVIDPSTMFTVQNGTDPVDLGLVEGVQIERVHKTGVFDEELIPGIHYEIFNDPPYTYIHILEPIILNPGDALEIKFDFCTYRRPILEREELRDICWLAQWKMYYLNPYNPIYSRNYINLFKPGLIEYVPSEGFGSCPSALTMPWTFGHIHWDGVPVGGSMNWHCSGLIESINPILASWVYEVMVINRLFDSLVVTDPYTHDPKPWVATDFELTAGTPMEPDGTTLTVWIRDDVRWHDGLPVTAADIEWNFDFINSTQAPELVGIWQPYLGCNVVSPYVIEIYYNATGLWKANDYLGAALFYPEQIWAPFWGNYEAAIAFEPWAVSYQDHTGNPPPADKPTLTAYVGTGPFWMDFYDDITETGHLWKNCDYWRRYPAGPGLLAGSPYDQTQELGDPQDTLNENDLWFFASNWINYYTTGDVNVFSDFDSNLVINEDDLFAFAGGWICYYSGMCP
jgi:hypothetical protein